MSEKATEEMAPFVRAMVTICVMMATIMQALDMTIANVALPYMQGSLSTTQDQINWVLTSYIVAAAIMTSPLGWMAGRFGRKKLFIVCAAGFTVASMLCGIAQSIEQMVAFRLLQGMFGAALVPISQAVMLDAYPPAKRGQAMAIWGMGVMLGPIMGPTLGGWLTENYTWRWVFFVNLPFGILTVLGLSAFMRESPIRRDAPFSWFGFLSLSLGIGALQMMLDRGQEQGWFEFQRDRRRDDPVYRRLLFLLRRFADLEAPVHRLAHLPRLEFLHRPDLHVPDRHHPADDDGAGDAVHPEPLGLSRIVQRLSPGHARHRHVFRDDDRRPPARQIRCADHDLLWADAGDGLPLADGRVEHRRLRANHRHQLDRARGRPRVRLRASQHRRLRDAAGALRTEGAALWTLIRNIGSSVGISVFIAQLTNMIATFHSQLVEHVTPFNDAMRLPDAMALAGRSLHDLAAFDGLVTQQAAIMAYSNDFLLMTFVSLSAFPLLALIRSSKAAPAAKPDEHAAVMD